MKLYCSKVVQLIKNFRRIDIQAIKRELNARAAQLAKGAAYGEYDKKSKVTTASDHFLDVNMIETTEDLKSDSVEEGWMDPIIDYLRMVKSREIRVKPENCELKPPDIRF